MSIETLLTELKEALDRNTAALEKAAGAAPAAAATTADAPASTGKRGRPAAAKDDTPKVTQEQVNAALIKLKDDFGMPEAKKIIVEFGKCEKMAEIKPAQYQAVLNAAVEKHAELSEGGSDDDI